MDIRRRRYLLLFGQKQLIPANVFRAELIRWLSEVLGELSDSVQIEPDRGRRIMADLEIFQHPLAKWVHNKSEKRLARVLLLLANFGKEGTPELVIPQMSQETLAEIIGTTRSRVSFS
jgi:hypothetical protein